MGEFYLFFKHNLTETKCVGWNPLTKAAGRFWSVCWGARDPSECRWFLCSSSQQSQASLVSILPWSAKWVPLVRNQVPNLNPWCPPAVSSCQKKRESFPCVLCFHGAHESLRRRHHYDRLQKQISCSAQGVLSRTISYMLSPLSRPWRKPVAV